MRIRAALAAAALALVVLATRSAAQDDKVSYLPLKTGNQWTYKLDIAGQNLAITQKVTKVEKKDGHDIATLEMQVMGQMVSEQISSTAKGIFRHNFNGIPVDPPMQILRLPVKKGDMWDTELNIMGQKAKASCKADQDEVTVPAGKYKAVTVAIEVEVMGQQIKTKYWFAPNVGIVKQSFDFGAVSGTSELEKVELAK